MPAAAHELLDIAGRTIYRRAAAGHLAQKPLLAPARKDPFAITQGTQGSPVGRLNDLHVRASPVAHPVALCLQIHLLRDPKILQARKYQILGVLEEAGEGITTQGHGC